MNPGQKSCALLADKHTKYIEGVRGLLEFQEDIDSTEWGGQSQSGILYKAPFLPSALRITIRVVDDRGENPRTLQRIVWVRRRSR